MARGPLAEQPADTRNYRLAGPAPRLLLDAFPRRVRAVAGDATLLDSRRGALLHRSGALPQLYVPEADLRAELLDGSGRREEDAAAGARVFRTLRCGARVLEDAAWTHPEPPEAAAWLRGLVAVAWDAADTWLDEDEEVHGHLRDPYHRIDVRQSGARVQVRAGDTLLADTTRAVVLSETGLPNRWYVPPEDVRAPLEDSDTSSHCPYKGQARYWSARVGGRLLEDAAFAYEAPFEDAAKVGGRMCFVADGITTSVDGEPAG